MFAQSAEKALQSMTRMVEDFKSLPKEEQDHQMKYHLGSIYIDCPICGNKGYKRGI